VRNPVFRSIESKADGLLPFADAELAALLGLFAVAALSGRPAFALLLTVLAGFGLAGLRLMSDGRSDHLQIRWRRHFGPRGYSAFARLRGER
jgi:hypothetical protein